MIKLSIEEIVEKINNMEAFSAISGNDEFSITIEKYVPFVCAAIHNGGNFLKQVSDKLHISKFERWNEEDPLTGSFILPFPIRIIVYDSRYEYDLNRNPENCIYEYAWNKQVYETPLTQEEKKIFLTRHENFYKVINALISKLEKLFKACVVFDIHSYNHQRFGEKRDLPLFNLGTEKVNTKKFGKYINYITEQLLKIKIEGVVNRVAINEVFFGRGYFLEYITKNFKNTLVLATEIKKVYVDENTGDEFPGIIEDLKNGLKETVLNTSNFFINDTTTLNVKQKYNLLGETFTDGINLVDNQLHKLVSKIDFLTYINPVNIETEKSKFIKSKYKKTPVFRYKHLTKDIYFLKKNLYSIPIDKIKDATIKSFYTEVIEKQSIVSDLLLNRGNHTFLYNSLRNYGEPSKTDIENARFLISAVDNANNAKTFTADEAFTIFKEHVDRLNIKCKVEVSSKIVSKVMMVKNTVLRIRKNSVFTENEIIALVNHEIGVHLFTTLNSKRNRLKVLRFSLPGATETQEGLAILSEMLSGNMTVKRLKELAYRTILIKKMLNGISFNEAFLYLKEEHGFEDDNAFYLTTRVFRSGGLTKDRLYLSGFKKMYDYYKQGRDLSILYTGKTSERYRDILFELQARGLIDKPKYINPCFSKPEKIDPVIEFIADSLK